MCIYLTNNKTARMKNSNTLRGYYDFPIGDNKTKTMHFSMNFVFILQDIVNKDLTKWLKEMEVMDDLAQGLAMSQLVFAGFAAYDLEEDNEVDYNVYKVRDWLFNAITQDNSLVEEIITVMTKSFSQLGKNNPVKK